MAVSAVFSGGNCDLCLVFVYIPAPSGSVRHRRGRKRCRVASDRLGAVGRLGLEELVEVEWVQSWAWPV